MVHVYDGEILEPEPNPGKSSSDERKVRGGFWRTFKKAAARIPFAEDLVASYYCALDPHTPHRTRLILFGALAYFVLPMDWIPDFIFGVGFTDDIAVLTGAIAAIRSSIMPAHYEAARAALADRDIQQDQKS